MSSSTSSCVYKDQSRITGYVHSCSCRHTLERISTAEQWSVHELTNALRNANFLALPVASERKWKCLITRRDLAISLFSPTSRSAPRTVLLPIQWAAEALSPRGKATEAWDHSAHLEEFVKLYHQSPLMPSRHTFTLTTKKYQNSRIRTISCYRIYKLAVKFSRAQYMTRFPSDMIQIQKNSLKECTQIAS
jgi:hypothetical protein